MVMMGGSLVEAGGQDLELTVAHEVAHQWWYAMVGSDSYYQPWQDESLCEYAVMDYVGQWYGAQAREDFRVQRVEAALRTGTAQTVTPGSPIDYFADLEEYTLVCYRPGRGPCGRPWNWPWVRRSWTASCALMWKPTASAAPPGRLDPAASRTTPGRTGAR